MAEVMVKTLKREYVYLADPSPRRRHQVDVNRSRPRRRLGSCTTQMTVPVVKCDRRLRLCCYMARRVRNDPRAQLEPSSGRTPRGPGGDDAPLIRRIQTGLGGRADDSATSSIEQRAARVLFPTCRGQRSKTFRSPSPSLKQG